MILCCNDECRVVCIGVYCGLYRPDDIVDVEEEEGCGECAALGDAVRDSSCRGLCMLCVCGLESIVKI